MRSCSFRIPLRRLWPLYLLLIGIIPFSRAESDPPPAKDAMSYPAVDIHAKEQVAIAAEPFDTPEKCKVFHVDYLKYRFFPSVSSLRTAATILFRSAMRASSLSALVAIAFRQPTRRTSSAG